MLLLWKVIALVQRSCIVFTVNETLTWPAYLRIITDGAPGVEIAKHAEVPPSTVSRWMDGTSKPRPRQVVKVARAYGVHPLQALVVTGYLEPQDADLVGDTPRKLQLRDFTDLEIAEETVRRIAEGQSAILEAPLDENHPAMQNVSAIRKDKNPRLQPEAVAALRDEEMNQDEKFD